MAVKGDTRRRFEQWVNNPTCNANAMSAVLNLRMTKVVKHEKGVTMPFGQSPFALSRGDTFERALFKKDAERLRGELIKQGIIPPKAAFRFIDLRQPKSGDGDDKLRLGRDKTEEKLRSLAKDLLGKKDECVLLAGPTILIPGRAMIPDSYLIIDALVLRSGIDSIEAEIGEVKVYPDRGGYTDRGSLATARAQAGVYLHGLRTVLDAMKLMPPFKPLDHGFLVLSVPGSSRPSVRANEDFRYQAERAERGFEQLRTISKDFGHLEGNDEAIAKIADAPVEYGEQCLAFCDRARTCHKRALESGLPVALGDAMAQLLGETSLHRALELLDGASPKGPSEKDLAERLATLKSDGSARPKTTKRRRAGT